jgi:hypothetical protein
MCVHDQIYRKLSSLQFPRRCVGVLRVPLTQVLAATGEALSLDTIGGDAQAAEETVLVVASSRYVANVLLICRRNELPP